MRYLISAEVTMSGSYDMYIEADSKEEAEELACEMVENIDSNEVSWNDEVELLDDYEVRFEEDVA